MKRESSSFYNLLWLGRSLGCFISIGKMKYLLGALCALLLALSASAFPRPSSNVPVKCADPTFACQDLQSARVCNVVKSCIHDVWSTMSAPKDNDEVCDICKEMVKEARDQLLSNMTQEEIKEVFEGSCKLLPVKLVADACIKVVDEIIPELVEMLASRMDPTMVCTVSGMCFSTRNGLIDNHVLNFLKTLLIRNKETQCQECTQMVTDVQVFLHSATESEIKNDVEKLCKENLPSYLCNIVLNEYFAQIYNAIISTEPAKLCASAGICPQKCTPHEEPLRVNDDLTCEFCYHLIEHVKQLITTNTTVEEFRTALFNFCNHTGSFHTKCTELVTDYCDTIFQYIRSLDAKGMCTLIGLCNNTDTCSEQPLVKIIPSLEVRKRIPLMRLRPAKKVAVEEIPLVRLIPANVFSKKQLDDSNNIFDTQLPLERVALPLGLFQRDTECAMCKAFSFYLEKDLAGDRSKIGVRKAIEGVCSNWMKDYPDHCHRIVREHSHKMQLAIAKGTAFSQLCISTKTCPLEEETSGINVRVLPQVHGSPLCDLCKEALTEVENMLADPKTKVQLENLLGQVCTALPASLKDDCTNFINQNIDAVIDILEQELKPDNVCPQIGLCPSSLRIPPPPRVKDLECDVCKDVVTSLRQKLEDPESKVIVQTFLEEACIRLPQSVATECKKFVDENIDTVLSILVQEMDPATVCSILSICPASLKKDKPQPLKDVECDICKKVVSELQTLMKNGHTLDEIKKILDQLCSYMPSSLSGQCRNFVDQYAEILVRLLDEELDPKVVCSLLDVCPESLKKKLLPREKGVECEFCKQVVGELEVLIKDERTESEIKSALDKVCSILPASISVKCQSFVNQYTDLLITILAEELDPALVCSALNLCPGSVTKVEKASKVKDIECDLCKEVVAKVEDMIKDKKTEDEIKNALDEVCSLLPKSIAAKCESFVNQYTELLITLLAQELDPSMVCASLKVCPANSRYSELLSKAQDLECQSCQYALHYLQEQLMNADTQDEVKNLLKKVCTLLPETYANNCDAFVEEYGASLLTLFAQELDPSTFCVEMKMCGNNTIYFEHLIKIQPPLTRFHLDECSVCTTVVDYLDKLLEEDDVDKEITEVVEKVCTVVPASFKSKCSTILEAYGPYILQMIGQLTDSKELCQDIDLCARPSGHVHLLGGSKCTFGPSYWCASSAHAAACKAEEFCKTRYSKS